MCCPCVVIVLNISFNDFRLFSRTLLFFLLQHKGNVFHKYMTVIVFEMSYVCRKKACATKWHGQADMNLEICYDDFSSCICKPVYKTDWHIEKQHIVQLRRL